MSEREQAQNPYQLSTEELTCPDTGKSAWFKRIIALQREGIDNGVRPQNPIELGKRMREMWVGQVWNYWAKTLSEEDQRAIRDTTQPGEETHTGPNRSTYRY